MRKPDESLDDYIVKPASKANAEPPSAVSLRPSGEVDILKPLARREVISTSSYPFRSIARHQPLWFRRLVAVGSGAIALIALVLVSAILVGIGDQASGPEVAIDGSLDSIQTGEPILFGIFSPSTLAMVNGEIDIVRSKVRRRPARPSIHLASYKPRRRSRPLVQPEEPKFFPTTLVIYAENGVINTRIEPWLQASYKPLTY